MTYEDAKNYAREKSLLRGSPLNIPFYVIRESNETYSVGITHGEFDTVVAKYINGEQVW